MKEYIFAYRVELTDEERKLVDGTKLGKQILYDEPRPGGGDREPFHVTVERACKADGGLAFSTEDAGLFGEMGAREGEARRPWARASFRNRNEAGGRDYGILGVFGSPKLDVERRQSLALYEPALQAYRSSVFATMDHDRFEMETAERAASYLDRENLWQPFFELIHATVETLYDLEELRAFPGFPDRPLTMSEGIAFREKIRQYDKATQNPEGFLDKWQAAVSSAIGFLIKTLPHRLYLDPSGEEIIGRMTLVEAIKEPLRAFDWILLSSVGDELNVSGISTERREIVKRIKALAGGSSGAEPPLPSQLKRSPKEVAHALFKGTSWEYLIDCQFPVARPFPVRFEHTVITAGSGWGKTQLLQSQILNDIHAVAEGKGSVIVIDSQGGILNNITHLDVMSELDDDQFVYIDPNDPSPPHLNLFDFGLDRINQQDARERERMTLAAISMYSYLFGALLKGALTQRQGRHLPFHRPAHDGLGRQHPHAPGFHGRPGKRYPPPRAARPDLAGVFRDGVPYRQIRRYPLPTPHSDMVGHFQPDPRSDVQP